MSSSDSGSVALGRFPFLMDFSCFCFVFKISCTLWNSLSLSTENPWLFLRRCRSMLWINALRDEGSRSSPFFFSHSKNKFFDYFLQFHGRNIFNFPLLVKGVKIYSLKTFMSYETSNMQSRHRDFILHRKWLQRETNENTLLLLYFIPRWITAIFLPHSY